MKKILIVMALVAPFVANAQVLLADPIPASQPQPSAAWFVATNASGVVGEKIGCNLAGSPLAMSCPLGGLTGSGVYQLVATYQYKAGCLGGVCWGDGEASSAPFAYMWIGAPALQPQGVKVAIR